MKYQYIHNGTLLDCTGASPLANWAVLLEDNKIKEVGEKGKFQVPQNELEEIDAQGGTIMPGFIDTHVHLNGELFNLEEWVSRPFSYTFYQTIDFMRRTLMAGVTSVRDAGGVDYGMKKAVEDGLIVGPRMQISITLLSTTGGHNDNWLRSGIDPNLFTGYQGCPDGRCDGVEEVRKKVREVLRAGADIIKICSTGGVMSPTDKPEYTQFSPEELAVIVQEAAYHGGKKVMAHAQGKEGIKQAILAGIYSIEHGIFTDDEICELMLKNGTFLVPTLLATLSIVEDPEVGGKMPAMMLHKAQEVGEIHKKNIARAYRAGVKIAMGTDAGVMPHGINLRELELLCEIGMSPMESILASTRVAAECLGWQDRVGTLEKGKLADVVITRKNPLEDIHSLVDPSNILMVIKDGKIAKDIR
jgi:imidazolonepropionase-like amidohydrolase